MPECEWCTTMSNLWSDFKSWYSAPFQSDMSAGEWALFVGLLIVSLMAWGFVFRHIKGFE
jgi:hypothetical protein